jgi:hypothetical protein
MQARGAAETGAALRIRVGGTSGVDGFVTLRESQRDGGRSKDGWA